jgi:hypothetical protein
MITIQPYDMINLDSAILTALVRLATEMEPWHRAFVIVENTKDTKRFIQYYGDNQRGVALDLGDAQAFGIKYPDFARGLPPELFMLGKMSVEQLTHWGIRVLREAHGAIDTSKFELSLLFDQPN